ncbi:hypothetical protein ACHAQA_009095 [Verticillium albo-atrum]
MAPFPNLPLDSKDEGEDDGAQSSSQAESSNQDTQGQPRRLPLTEDQIQDCLRRANQVYTDPLTNTTRRNTNVPAGRNRNRSATVSYSRPPLPNLPHPPPTQTQAQGPDPTQLGTRVPHVVVTNTNATRGRTSGREPLTSTERTFVRGRGRGLSVPGRTSYIPTLPDSDRPTSSGRGRTRPVPIGAFDNPLTESQQRRADRDVRTQAVNEFREVQRRREQQRRHEEEQRSQLYRQQQQQQAEGQAPTPSHHRPLPSAPAGRYPVGTPTVLRRPQPLAGQEPTHLPRSSSLALSASILVHENPLRTDTAPSAPRHCQQDQQFDTPATPHDWSQQDSPTGDSDGSEEPEFQLGTAQIGYTVVARTPRTLPPTVVTRSTLAQSFSLQSFQFRLSSQPSVAQSTSSGQVVPRQQPSSQGSSSTKPSSKARTSSKDQKKSSKALAKPFQRTELSPVCEEDSENGTGSEDEESDDELIGPSDSRRPRDRERRDDQGPPPDSGTSGTSGTRQSGSESADQESSNQKRNSSGGARRVRSIFGLKKKNQAFVLVLIIAIKDTTLVVLV